MVIVSEKGPSKKEKGCTASLGIVLLITAHLIGRDMDSRGITYDN